MSGRKNIYIQHILQVYLGFLDLAKTKNCKDPPLWMKVCLETIKESILSRKWVGINGLNPNSSNTHR